MLGVLRYIFVRNYLYAYIFIPTNDIHHKTCLGMLMVQKSGQLNLMIFPRKFLIV